MFRLRAIFLSVSFLCVLGVASGQSKPRVVHVFVALTDNEHQGIVPAPPVLGNGDDPARNPYRGAAFGVRTFFKESGGMEENVLFQAAQ